LVGLVGTFETSVLTVVAIKTINARVTSEEK